MTTNDHDADAPVVVDFSDLLDSELNPAFEPAPKPEPMQLSAEEVEEAALRRVCDAFRYCAQTLRKQMEIARALPGADWWAAKEQAAQAQLLTVYEMIHQLVDALTYDWGLSGRDAVGPEPLLGAIERIGKAVRNEAGPISKAVWDALGYVRMYGHYTEAEIRAMFAMDENYEQDEMEDDEDWRAVRKEMERDQYERRIAQGEDQQ